MAMRFEEPCRRLHSPDRGAPPIEFQFTSVAIWSFSPLSEFILALASARIGCNPLLDRRLSTSGERVLVGQGSPRRCSERQLRCKMVMALVEDVIGALTVLTTNLFVTPRSRSQTCCRRLTERCRSGRPDPWAGPALGTYEPREFLQT